MQPDSCLIENIIPVTFFGGTGGNFLSSFLSHALAKDYSLMSINESGNMHSNRDSYTNVGLFIDTTGHINLRKILRDRDKDKELRFPSTHIADPSLALKYFKKVIKTYFTDDQYLEIMGVFYLKNNYFLKEPVDFSASEERDILLRFINRRIEEKKEFTRLCENCPDLEPNLLNVSWSEMVYEDPNNLIEKLGVFTGIPVENFNIINLLEWRRLTIEASERAKRILSYQI
jgi:hypothetical protein